MLRLAVREVFRRRLRAFLLALTVIISGSFMVAILILGDSLLAGLEMADVDQRILFGGQDGIEYVRNILLFFNFLAFVVGVFVIANTFWVILSQRAYELALLRVIGASKGQVFITVIWESLFVGLIGGLVSIACGIGLAQGFFSLSDALDWEVAHAGLRFSPLVFILPMTLALLITVGAAILPAIVASRRSPLASMTAVYGTVKNKHKLLLIFGLALAALGGLLQSLIFLSSAPDLSEGSLGPSSVQLFRMSILWAGQGFVFVGAALLAIPLAKWSAGFFRWLLRRSRLLSWRLAVNNIWRQPARTAFTANVLMIGIVLVATITVIASSVQLTIIDLVDRTRGSDWTLRAAVDQPEGEETPDWLWVPLGPEDVDPEKAQITPEILQNLSDSPATDSVMGVRFAFVSAEPAPGAEAPESDEDGAAGAVVEEVRLISQSEELLASVDGAVFVRLYDQAELSQESLANLEAGQVLVSENFLRFQADDLAVGDSISLSYDPQVSRWRAHPPTPGGEAEEAETTEEAGKEAVFVIGGIFQDFSFDLDFWGVGFLLSHESLQGFLGGENYSMAEFDNAAGYSHEETQQALEGFLADNQDLALSGKLHIINFVNLVIRWLVNIFRALLALAIIVAIIGVLNTLVLAVSERSREIGLLRAIGSSAATMRRTLALEAVFIATLGVVLGVGLALLFAWGSIEVSVNQPTGAAQASLADTGEEQVGRILFSIPWAELFLYYVVAIFLAWLASVVPAIKATRVKIVEALRSG